MPCANSGMQRPLNSGQQPFVQSSKFREGSHAPPSQFFFVSKSVYLFQRLHPVCLFGVSQSSEKGSQSTSTAELRLRGWDGLSLK